MMISLVAVTQGSGRAYRRRFTDPRPISVPNPRCLRDHSVHVVQVYPANRAEPQQRVRTQALGQRLLRELPELDTRLQQDLDDGPKNRLGSLDYIRSEQRGAFC
jgi:hypothetical protein